MLFCLRWLSLILLVLLTPTVSAQGTRADYERADNLPQQFRGKVFRTDIKAHWLPGGTKFWYRVQTGANSAEFVLVDAQAGKKRPAFPHEKLAGLLAEKTGREVSAANLPFRAIDVSDDGNEILFSAFGKSWSYQPKENKLEQKAGAKEANESTAETLSAPRSSAGGGEETTLHIVNKTSGRISLSWVNFENREQFYAHVATGKTHSQHTYGGHVWVMRDEKQNVVGIFAARNAESTAVIDGRWKPALPKKESSPKIVRRSGPNSPDGNWRAEIENFNVVLVHRETGERFSLSTEGTEDDPFRSRFFWSPDSRKLIALRERPGEDHDISFVESSPRDQLQPKLHTFRYVKPGDRLPHLRPRLFDISAKKQIPVSEELFPNPWSLGEFLWATDSRRFTFLYNQRGHQALRLVAIDAETGTASAIINETSDTFICYSRKFFLRRMEDTQELIWMSERDGWNHLYLYDAQTGAVKNQITRGNWVVRKVDRVDVEKRQIWFQAGGIHPEQDPYHVHFCRVNFDGSGLVVLTAGDGTHEITFSPDQKYFLDTYSRVDLPPVTELRKTSDGSLVCELERGDWSALLEAGYQIPLRFQTTGRDDKTPIYGVIFRPTNFEPKKNYPVIEQIYAGPHSSHVPKRFQSYHGEKHSLTELGFVVVQIDGMGTSNRSKAFHDVCWQNIGDAGFPDRVRWLQTAAKKYPWMDVSRLGIYGGSAGGQNAMRALIAHGDFYDVAVADCGCHDNRMDKIWWNEQWMGWPLGPHYAESSNVDQAHRMQGKLLLIVGELDRNVDPASTMQVVDALVKADKDFDLLVIPGAGHGAAGTRYGKRRQRDYFVRHLLGVEPRTK